MTMSPSRLDVAVVGSIGLDTIETPHHRREEILGGSASFACAAASFFSRVGMVGIVGTDFPAACTDLFDHFSIDLKGLQVAEGRTFRWSGVYEANMDNRETLSTDLNVFADFLPDVPAEYRGAPFVFLANISPDLQLHVLDQIESPRFVAADTMDLWINVAHGPLGEVIKRVDMLMMNESEARHYTGVHNLVQAAHLLLVDGPAYVLIKKGEHGSILFSEHEMFVMPAFPLREVTDPTGAGDSFAGGFIGALADAGEVTPETLRTALVCGNILASFGVEAFSLEKFHLLERLQIDERISAFKEMTQIP